MYIDIYIHIFIKHIYIDYIYIYIYIAVGTVDSPFIAIYPMSTWTSSRRICYNSIYK